MLSLPAGLSEFCGLLEHHRTDFAPGKFPASEMQQHQLSCAQTGCVHLTAVSESAWLRTNAVVITQSLESLGWLKDKGFQWDTHFFEMGFKKLTFPRKTRICTWEMVYWQEDLGLSGFLFVQVFTVFYPIWALNQTQSIWKDSFLGVSTVTCTVVRSGRWVQILKNSSWWQFWLSTTPLLTVL